MGGAFVLFIIFVLVFLAFVCFAVYFIFKQVEFVLTATNLYKKMITRQDSMIKLLIDIRDGTKQFDLSKVPEAELSEPSGQIVGSAYCSNCYKAVEVLASNPGKCPLCGKDIA